jgi:hypothetical protein
MNYYGGSTGATLNERPSHQIASNLCHPLDELNDKESSIQRQANFENQGESFQQQ